MTSLKDRLMHDIKDGKVSMRPRIYFTLRLAALVATVLAILAITVFIVNFISFSIRISMNDTLLGFGAPGVGAFLAHFPWHLAVLDALLVLLLQYLLRHFRFGYRIPILYVVMALVAGAGLVGFALDRTTPFNDRMHEKRMHLPPGPRGLYDGVRPPPRGSGICRCRIISIDGNVMQVEDLRPGGATSTLTVMLPLDSRRATSTGLSVGDIVFIAGEEQDGIIEAFGVRKGSQRGQRP